jgi:hypothetical protein
VLTIGSLHLTLPAGLGDRAERIARLTIATLADSDAARRVTDRTLPTVRPGAVQVSRSDPDATIAAAIAGAIDGAIERTAGADPEA